MNLPTILPTGAANRPLTLVRNDRSNPFLNGVPRTLQEAAAFGLWHYDARTAELVLSSVAAKFLYVEEAAYRDLNRCFAHVATEDQTPLVAALSTLTESGKSVDFRFRVLSETQGERWLRLASIRLASDDDKCCNGFLTDITAHKHAAMRERFNFEFSKLLVGTHTFGDVVTKSIRLVCQVFGWEWGAYWALEEDAGQGLACKHYWHDAAIKLDAFSIDSDALRIPVDKGLVGKIWSSGRAAWIEGMSINTGFLRQHSARACGLKSGYAFPVSYQSPDGGHHKLGVLEFYSMLPRRQSAQLPLVANSIGALIAQTVQRIEQEVAIRLLAEIDGLTGLANRNHSHHLIEKACFDAASLGTSFGLLYIDLDRFKPINDAFGHDAGNVVLQEFADRIRALTHGAAFAGRLGGDEFCVVTTANVTEESLADLSRAILAAAQTPVLFKECQLVVSASIGISVFPNDGHSAPDLLRNADVAMYRSKSSGRNAFNFYSSASPHPFDGQRSLIIKRMQIEADLHHALSREEFFLEYQPIFEAHTNRMVGMEALIRWRRGDGEIVSPDDFIPLAEETGMIAQIDRWVVRRACFDLATLRQAGFKGLWVSVNMAASEFANEALAQELHSVVRNAGIEPHFLCLELTEGTMMKRPDKIIPVMRTLRDIGFRISLDDFGMGYSSLSRLKRLPLTSIKIDRSFVSGLPVDLHDKAFVRTILELGRDLDLTVIAEGVETDAQLTILRELGCPLIQGYLFSKPRSLAMMRSGQAVANALAN